MIVDMLDFWLDIPLGASYLSYHMSNDPSSPQTALVLHEAVKDKAQRDHVHKMLDELLITVSDKVFVNQTIFVDGYRFINCSFEDCGLEFLRGTFEFHHCFLLNCKRWFNEGALKAVQAYAINDATFAGYADPAFLPKVHPDGSFSIGRGASII